MYENNKWKYACLVLAHNCARKPLLKESERETEKKNEMTGKRKDMEKGNKNSRRGEEKSPIAVSHFKRWIICTSLLFKDPELIYANFLP